jgi:enoyl-CoA hydratase
MSASDPQPPRAAYQEIRYTTAERVAAITLNVPDKRNRISYLMRREIIDALRRAEEDDDVTVILIRASGPSFCAGYDLSPSPRQGENSPRQGENSPRQGENSPRQGENSSRQGENSPRQAADGGAPPPSGASYYRDDGVRPEQWVNSAEFNDWTDQWARSCVRDWYTIWNLLKPVVAMVHGHCVAGGTELMSMCDIAFVADDARIGYPPMRGMSTPDVPYFPWKMSMAHAKYLQLTGNSVTGAEAARMGWVAKSFPAGQLEAETMRELRAISSIAPGLLAANKHSVNQAYEIQGMKTHLDQSWSWHALSSRFRPGAGTFRDKLADDGLKAALDWRDGAFRDEGFI